MENKISFLRGVLYHSMIPVRKMLSAGWRYRNPDLGPEGSPDVLSEQSPASIVDKQLAAFNQQWKRIRVEDPFYSWWAAEHNLPIEIDSLNRLREFPALTRQTLLEQRDLVFSGREHNPVVTTGGSTGSPLCLPTSDEDMKRSAKANWKARSWYGINRFDPYVHVWGHAHHFGNGYKKFLRSTLRATKDLIANATRMSVYLTDEKSMIEQARMIESVRPRYIIGFSSAILRLAKIANTHEITVRNQNLIGVILTADNASKEDVELISSVFAAPVIVEYGAIEVGVIAHSNGESYPLTVLTESLILSADANGDATVTTLQRNSFPLINYSIGDRLDADRVEDGSILSVKSLAGRSHERLKLLNSNGSVVEFDARLAFQSLKKHRDVSSIQFLDLPDKLHALIVTNSSVEHIHKELVSDLRITLGAIDPLSISVEPRDAPVQTIAGKVPLMIR